MKQENHALKIEDLELKQTQADAIVSALEDFALELGYSKDRIDSLECRRRDGVIPYSHNFGGIGCVAFRDQYSACENTGFENADSTLAKYSKYDEECFRTDKGISKDSELTDAQLEELDEYRMNDTESTILFGLDMMLTGENSLNLRFTVCVKDSPYHRQYDDLLSHDVEFKTTRDLKAKLKKLLKNNFVRCFEKNLREAY